MSDNDIDFAKPDPKLIEACNVARAMNGGGKCAQPDCTFDGQCCSQDGCLLEGYQTHDR